jgi:hypothetical protein
MATHEQELKDDTAALEMACAEFNSNGEELERMHNGTGLSHIEQPMRKAYLVLRNKYLDEVCTKLTESVEKHRAAIAWEARTR